MDSPILGDMYDEREDDARRAIRAMLGQLVVEGRCFSSKAEEMNFVAHGGFGACRCPQCQGKIAVYRKGMGKHKGEPAIKKFTCTCSYSDDSVGFFSALAGVDEKRAYGMLKDRVRGAGPLEAELLRARQEAAMEAARRKADGNLSALRLSAKWGKDMGHKALALLRSRAIDVDALARDGVLERIGYVSGLRLQGGRDGKGFTVSGFVFEKGPGVKLRRTVDRSRPSFDVGHKLRFLSYGESGAFGSSNLEEKDDVVYVTEGEFDALSLIGHGARAVAVSGVANLKAFDAYVAKEDPDHRRTYVVAFDGDEAGRSALAPFVQHAAQLGCRAFAFPLSAGEKDVNDLDRADPDALEARVRASTLLARRYADGSLSRTGLEEALDSWRRIDGLAAVAPDAADRHADMFISRLSDIQGRMPDNEVRRTFDGNGRKEGERAGREDGGPGREGMQR